MAYFIFSKNLGNLEGTIYRIAENESDLNNLNINKSDYKIIEDSQLNFESVKYGTKFVDKYNQDLIIYQDANVSFKNEEELKPSIENCKNIIQEFTKNNKNHPLFNKWNDYYNQLNSLNLDSITYPLNKSLEQYFKDQNLPSLNTLQLP
jgi:mRNA-degrading endonuclease YafQ of YafQ-DinJ toxin-antitoxin module